MDQVYKQGYLNVSADWNMDARDGLFTSRSPMRIQPLIVGFPEMRQAIQITVDERDMFDWVNTAPLSQRAWAFQERHLARRLLHFTEGEMFWECCSKKPHFASDTYPNGSPRFLRLFRDKPGPIDLDNPTPSLMGIHELWRELCEMYSERKLSKPTDRLVALTGLAKKFQQLLPRDTYFSGMWWSTFPLCLLWRSQGRPIGGDAFPSWSWVSIDGDVILTIRGFNVRLSSNSESSSSKHTDRFKISKRQKMVWQTLNLKNETLERTRSQSTASEQGNHFCEALDVLSLPLPTELLNGKQTEALVVRGFLRRVDLRISGIREVLRHWKKPKWIPSMRDEKVTILLHEDDGQYEIELADVGTDLDTGGIPDFVEAYLLFIITCQSGHSAEISGLLLEKQGVEPNTFRRIGVLEIKGYAAMALRYRVKSGASDPQSVWNSFKHVLIFQSGDDSKWDLPELAKEWAAQFGQEDLSQKKSQRGSAPLYDHDWEFEDSQLEELTPQILTIV